MKHVLLFTGEDTFRIRQRVRALERVFAQKYPEGAVERLDSRSTLSDLTAAALTGSLFGGKRLVIAEGFWDKDKYAQTEKTDWWGQLAKCAETASVFFIEPVLDKRLKWAKYLLKTFTGQAPFDPLQGSALTRWVADYATQQGGKMDTQTAKKLTEHCGHDLWRLSRETEKLVAYAGGEAVTSAMVETLCERTTETVVWDFLRLLSGRKRGEAMRLFRQMMQEGQSPHQLLALLLREVRVHILLKGGLAEGLRGGELAKATGLNPFVVKKTLPLSQKFNLRELAELHEQLCETDLALKSGGVSVSADDAGELELRLEQVIIAMTGSI